jgi:hypothetical protein
MCMHDRHGIADYNCHELSSSYSDTGNTARSSLSPSMKPDERALSPRETEVW